MKSRRGQSFSGEMLLAFAIFLACLILVLTLWDNSMRDVLSSENRRLMEEAGVTAAEKLIRTPGTPADWNRSHVASIGLANESRFLMPHKVKEFVRMMDDSEPGLCGAGMSKYGCNSYMLGMGAFHFKFNMTHLNGSVVKTGGVPAEAGRLWENSTDSLTIVRTALLGDEIVRIRLTVWR